MYERIRNENNLEELSKIYDIYFYKITIRRWFYKKIVIDKELGIYVSFLN